MHFMQPNAASVYARLREFHALAASIMGDQATHINSKTQSLSFGLADNLTSEQQKQFMDIVTVSHFLRGEIISYRTTHDVILRFLYRPTEVNWDEINAYSVAQQAVEDVKMFFGEDVQQLVTIEATDNEILVSSVTSLLHSAISHLIIWAHLLAIPNQILVMLTQSETEVTLKLLGSNLASNQLDFFEKEACLVFQGLIELIVTVLGGSFSWKTGQVIPDEDELVIHLPKRTPG